MKVSCASLEAQPLGVCLNQNNTKSVQNVSREGSQFRSELDSKRILQRVYKSRQEALYRAVDDAIMAAQGDRLKMVSAIIKHRIEYSPRRAEDVLRFEVATAENISS